MRKLTLLFTLFAIACSAPKKEESTSVDKKDEEKTEKKHPLISSIQEAHQIEAFQSEEIISFDMNLTFGGQERLNARIYSKTNSSKVLVDKNDGSQLLFDGKDVWIHPADSMYKGARFDVLTWSYFFLAPFKLNDPGTKHSAIKKMPYQSGNSLETTKLTFGDHVGDAPDDWYIVYQNEQTDFLEAMAYIVTFGGKSQDKAAENPHAVSYGAYKKVNNIPFAHEMKFWNWSKSEGLQDQLGHAQISKVSFSNDHSIFEKKANAAKVPLKK